MIIVCVCVCVGVGVCVCPINPRSFSENIAKLTLSFK